MNAKDMNQYADSLFTKKALLNSLHQEIADNFYPERADFAFKREVGEEFADHLMTSYPVLIRRDLGDQMGTMLRPQAQPWFGMVPADPERAQDNESKRWLEAATAIQRRAMYDPAAMLTRATKEGDMDYATFGMAAISSELVFEQEEGPHLLHRNWHLRDMAWVEDKYGKVGARFRKWKPSARDLATLFPGKVSASVQRLATGTGKRPLTEVEVLHMVVPADMYDINAGRKPWVSVFYDVTNKVVIEHIATYSPHYIIARWQTVSGSQYAYSPATIVGLPDARLIQAMTRTLLEAGEKIANPPLKATDEVVRSDIAIYPGGITWVDRDYDEKLGPALEPLIADVRGIPIGSEMMLDARQIIGQAFFLNKLTLPLRAPEMTAFEVGQRIQQYIRDALPIFEPMEQDYNGQLVELDFDLLRRGGAFGSPFDMPASLQGARVTFRFMSPLHDAIDAQKAQKFVEMGALLAEAVNMDPSAANMPDAKVALRDALAGSGVPQKWIRSEVQVATIEAQQKQEIDAQQLLANMQAGAKATADLAKASKDIGTSQPVL